MKKKTGFRSIGHGSGLVSTSAERSSNFEVFQMLFEVEEETNLWKSETKVGNKWGIWKPDRICKWMVSEECGGMQE